MAIYWVQTNDYMNPVSLDLTSAEVQGVRKLLEALASEGELVELADSDGYAIYDNYADWRNSSINNSTEIHASSNPYASRFSKIREAMDFLNTVDQDKKDLVEDCRDAIYKAYAEYTEPSEDRPFSSTESSIIRDYQSFAAEQWDELTVDEASDMFDSIYDALCIIHSDDAAAWW